MSLLTFSFGISSISPELKEKGKEAKFLSFKNCGEKLEL